MFGNPQDEKYWEFRMGGFPVQITASNLFICALLGFLWGARAGLWAGLAVGFIFFISIFLHECGHAFMSKFCGVKIFEMRLTGSGGYVRHETGISNPKAFFITLAGPLVNLILVILGNVFSGSIIIQGIDFFGIMSQINFLLFAFNLLPIVPLDGGYLLHRFLWMLYSDSKDGQIRVVKKWKYTPDQIVGKVGVVMGYLWIPLMALIFFSTGVIFIFFPPTQMSKELASGRVRLPL